MTCWKRDRFDESMRPDVDVCCGILLNYTNHTKIPAERRIDLSSKKCSQRVAPPPLLILAHKPDACAHQRKCVASQNRFHDIGRMLSTALIQAIPPISEKCHRKYVDTV